ncbi:fumarate hydratase [[Clostridium] cellulosi]
MREIKVGLITETVKRLCIDANHELSCDMEEKLRGSLEKEKSPLGKEVLSDLCRNLDAAREIKVPICQDTGMAVVFVDVGQDVHIVGGALNDAINEGVRRGYVDGLLRLSIVCDPLRRVNTGDNTPAVIHTRIVPGDQIKITVAPKGFGSENMSAIRMFTPAASRDDIIDFVVSTVEKAGSKPCPPVVVGVGIGGDFEYAALLAKKALCRPFDTPQQDEFYRQLEEDILSKINALGIGPQGFGGTVTALAVNIEFFATHIAGLPVAVNMGCHVTRHKTAVI